MEVFSSAQITSSFSPSGSPCQTRGVQVEHDRGLGGEESGVRIPWEDPRPVPRGFERVGGQPIGTPSVHGWVQATIAG